MPKEHDGHADMAEYSHPGGEGQTAEAGSLQRPAAGQQPPASATGSFRHFEEVPSQGGTDVAIYYLQDHLCLLRGMDCQERRSMAHAVPAAMEEGRPRDDLADWHLTTHPWAPTSRLVDEPWPGR